MKTSFTYLEDPGHGWLIVTPADLMALGLTEADFTPYSYQNRGQIGLEEDLDAEFFLLTYKLKTGALPDVKSKDGSCRNWAGYGTLKVEWTQIKARFEQLQAHIEKSGQDQSTEDFAFDTPLISRLG